MKMNRQSQHTNRERYKLRESKAKNKKLLEGDTNFPKRLITQGAGCNPKFDQKNSSRIFRNAEEEKKIKTKKLNFEGKSKKYFLLTKINLVFILFTHAVKSQIQNLSPLTSQQLSLGSYLNPLNAQGSSLFQVAKKIPIDGKKYLTYIPNLPYTDVNLAVVDLEAKTVTPVTISEVLDEDTVILEIEFLGSSGTSCIVHYGGWSHAYMLYSELDLSTMTIDLGGSKWHTSTSYHIAIEWDELQKFIYIKHTDLVIHSIFRGEPQLQNLFNTNVRDLNEGVIHSSGFKSKTSDPSIIDGSVGYFFDDETNPTSTFFWEVTVNNRDSVLVKYRYDDTDMLPLEIVPASELGLFGYHVTCSSLCKYVRVSKIGKRFSFIQYNGAIFKMISYDSETKITTNGDFPAVLEPSESFFLKPINEAGVYLTTFSISTFTAAMQSDARGMIDSHFYLVDPTSTAMEFKDITDLFNDIRGDFGASNKKFTKVVAFDKSGEILLFQDPLTASGSLDNLYADLVQVMPLKCFETCAVNQCSEAKLKDKCLSCADSVNMDLVGSTCVCKSATPIFEPSTQTCVSTCSHFQGTIDGVGFCLTKEEVNKKKLSTRDSTKTFITVGSCVALGDGFTGPCFDPLTFDCLEGPNTISNLRPNIGVNYCVDKNYCTNVLGFAFENNMCKFQCSSTDHYLTPSGSCITEQECFDFSDAHGELFVPYNSNFGRKLCIRKLNCGLSDYYIFLLDETEKVKGCIYADECGLKYSYYYAGIDEQVCFMSYNTSAIYAGYHNKNDGIAFYFQYCSFIYSDKRITVGPNAYPHFCVNQAECLELTDYFRWSIQLNRCVQKEVCLFESPDDLPGFCHTSCSSGKFYDPDIGECIDQSQCNKQIMVQSFADQMAEITVTSASCVNQQSCIEINGNLVRWNLDQSTCTKFDQCYEDYLVNPNTCRNTCSSTHIYPDFLTRYCYTEQKCLDAGKMPGESTALGYNFCYNYEECLFDEDTRYLPETNTCVETSACQISVSGNDGICAMTKCPVSDDYLDEASNTCYATNSCLLKDLATGTSYAVSGTKKRCFTPLECQNHPDFVYNLDLDKCSSKEYCYLVDGEGDKTCRYKCPTGKEYFNKATRTCYDATCGGDASLLTIDDSEQGKFCLSENDCKGFLDGKYVLKAGPPKECIKREQCLTEGSLVSSGECVSSCPTGFEYQHTATNACYDQTCGNNAGLFKFEDGTEKSCLSEIDCLAKGSTYLTKRGIPGECTTVVDCLSAGFFILNSDCVENCHGVLAFGDLENQVCMDDTCFSEPGKYPVDLGQNKYCVTEDQCENTNLAELVLVMLDPKQCVLKEKCQELGMFVYDRKCVPTCPADKPYANLELYVCQDASCGGDSSLIKAEVGVNKFCLSETTCTTTPFFNFLLKETTPKQCVTQSQCSDSSWYESEKKCVESCSGTLDYSNANDKKCYNQNCGTDSLVIPFDNGGDKTCLTKEQCINGGNLFQTTSSKDKCLTKEKCSELGLIRAQTECTSQCPSYLTYSSINSEACYDETCGGDDSLFKIITSSGQKYCVTQEQCQDSILGQNLVFLPGSCVSTEECHTFDGLVSEGFCVKKCPEGRLVAPNELECVTPDKCPDGKGDVSSGKCIGPSKNNGNSDPNAVDKDAFIAPFCTADAEGIPCYLGLVYDLYLRCFSAFVPSAALNSVANFNVFMSQSYLRLSVTSKMGFWDQNGHDYFYAQTFRDWFGEISKGLLVASKEKEIEKDCERGNTRYCKMGLSRNLIVNGLVVVLAIIILTVTTLCKGADTGDKVGEVVEIQADEPIKGNLSKKFLRIFNLNLKIIC